MRSVARCLFRGFAAIIWHRAAERSIRLRHTDVINAIVLQGQMSDGYRPPLQTNFHFREIPAFRHDRRYLSAEFLRIEVDRHSLRLAWQD